MVAPTPQSSSEFWPWADLSIDSSTYRRATYPTLLLEHGTWDADTGSYDLPDDPPFDDWFDHHYADQPYATREGGRVALWRLRLTLNQLGVDTLKAQRDLWLEDAYAQIAYDEELAMQRGVGTYYGEYVEAGPHRRETIEVLSVVTEYDHTGLASGIGLLSDHSHRRELAAALLTHATGRIPYDALIDAFIARYREELDDPAGLGLQIEAPELALWLEEVEAG